ncbi:MAG: S8 family serine peptidase [Rhodovulum sp.]|nr:S8 family serine peptidase [Rhodovulum sp.]
MTRRLARLAVTVALGAAASGVPWAALAQPLPTGGTPTHGAIGISQPSPSSLLVTQGGPAGIITWSTFSIGTGNTVHFDNGSGATLNRVTGNVPSTINGTLTATGSVFLVNQAGIAVGQTGIVQTGGSFVASTLDVKDAAFLAGRSMTFDGASTAAVVNLGRIGSAKGDVVLIARTVQNDGSITAPEGTAAMASGREVVLSDGALGNGKVQVKLPGGNGQVVNRGSIRAADVELRANGGNVLALAGNTDGVIKATGVANKGGRIFLTAEGGSVVATQRLEARRQATAPAEPDRRGRKGAAKTVTAGGDILIEADAVTIGGVLDAAGIDGAGGRIVVTGRDVTVKSGALLTASGTTGGLVLVGGDRGGGRAPGGALFDRPIRNAERVTVESGAEIRADGSSGAGGKVVVWSDGTTSFAGTVSAKGPGGGGFVETSGRDLVITGGRVDAGRGGTWLLDPDDLVIDTTLAGIISASLNAGTNVTQETTASGTGGQGDITILPGVTIAWNTGATLTLSAYRNIVFGSAYTFVPDAQIVNTGSGHLILRADNTGTGVGTVLFNSYNYYGPAIDFSGSTGSVSIYYNPYSYTSPTDYTAAVATGANARLAAYMLVNSVADLGNIGGNLGGAYALGRDIDATGFAGIDGHFDGILDGHGGLVRADGSKIVHTISHLGVASPNPSRGLFDVIGPGAVVRNLMLTGHVEGQAAESAVGLLAGINEGRIENVHVAGTMLIGTGNGVWAGGLVGRNEGTIVGSTADVAITSLGEHTVGGLAGDNQGLISGSSAHGDIIAGPTTSYGTYGGLVGRNAGLIEFSVATGSVTAGPLAAVGGLVGENNAGYFGPGGEIRYSAATGDVTGGAGAEVGGLVGRNRGTLFESIAVGVVTGGAGSAVGGAVGRNDGLVEEVSATGAVTTAGPGGTGGGLVGTNTGTIARSFATGAVTGDGGTRLGGLAGLNATTAYGPPAEILQSYATGAVTGTGTAVAGGLVGTNSGLVRETYAIGRVTTGAGGTAGGLIGVNTLAPDQTFLGGPGVVQSSYWDTMTSGRTTSAGGVGLTTFQLAGGLPPGFDPGVWNTLPGQTYPFLFGPPIRVPSFYDPGPLVTLVSLTPTGLGGFGPPDPNQSNITPPPSGDGTGSGGRGGQGGRGGAGGAAGNPGAGPPPGPGLDRSPSEQQFSGVPPLGETRFVPDEIVLQIPARVSRAEVEAIARRLGVEILSAEPIALTNRVVYRFRMGAGQDIRALILTLEQNRIVSSAQPNYTFGLARGPARDIGRQFAQITAPGAAPPDSAPDAAAPPVTPPTPGTDAPEPAAAGASDLASDLAARTTLPAGDPAQYVIQKLQLGTVHQRVRGANVTVAVIDSEIDARHPDLQGVIIDRFDATGDAPRPHTHGTGMAGAIASRFRLLGVAPGARLLAVRAFSEKAPSAEATTTQVLKGLDWVMARRPRIINMSFAGPRDLMTERILDEAYRQGIVLIAAAGNAGAKSPPLFPAADPNVIAVSATDNDDRPFAQANRGKHIAVAAPGVDVLVPSPNGAYQLTTGTSVAAAHVSGVVALLLEARPNLTPADIRAILTRTAKPLGPGKDLQTGAGLVDPIRSLAGIAPATASPVAPAPPPPRPGVVPAQPLR